MRRLHSPSVRLRFKDTAAGMRKELARCLVFAAGKREKNARQEPGAQSGRKAAQILTNTVSRTPFSS